MRVVMFYPSLVSCWDNPGAHFLRGIASELLARGHSVDVYEPRSGWSLTQLLEHQGREAVEDFHAAFPELASTLYDESSFDAEEALDGADLVIVSEATAPRVAAAIGRHRASGSAFRLLFHDGGARTASASEEIEALDPDGYDGVLAGGEVVRRLYTDRGWGDRAWTWHEAADVRRFGPPAQEDRERELVWIGEWGDVERSNDVREFVLEPVRLLFLRADIWGTPYPDRALRVVKRSGAEYRGWLPNHRLPEAFARARATVHLHSRSYAQALPGVPTTRMFEAMACGIPLVSTPWNDEEGLFEPGRDFLVAEDGFDMRRHLRAILEDESFASELGATGRERILERHTCGHRVDDLLTIDRGLGGRTEPAEVGRRRGRKVTARQR